jgi:hypothetical protein
MNATGYAMAWSVGDGPRRAGRVELDGERLLLGDLSVDLDEVRGVRRTRDVLLVHRHEAESIRIVSLDSPGTLRELAELLLQRSREPV